MMIYRVIPVLLYKGAGLVVSTRFADHRPVGTAVTTARLHDSRCVDELIFLDIAATPEGRGPDFDLVGEVAEQCFMPLTVGGGVRTIEDIRTLLSVGADKVAINTAALGSPSLLSSAALKFGSQALVFSIDALARESGSWEVIHRGGHAETWPAALAAYAAREGAGEILLQSIDRDGTMQGYDLDLIRSVSSAVRIPVIACGGAGKPEHFAEAIEAGADACAASAMFQFTEATPRTVCRALHERGIGVRL